MRERALSDLEMANTEARQYIRDVQLGGAAAHLAELRHKPELEAALGSLRNEIRNATILSAERPATRGFDPNLLHRLAVYERSFSGLAAALQHLEASKAAAKAWLDRIDADPVAHSGGHHNLISRLAHDARLELLAFRSVEGTSKMNVLSAASALDTAIERTPLRHGLIRSDLVGYQRAISDVFLAKDTVFAALERHEDLTKTLRLSLEKRAGEETRRAKDLLESLPYETRRISIATIAAIVLMVVAVALMALLAAFKFSRGTSRLLGGIAQATGKGRLDAPIAVYRRDEIGEITESFNAMMAALRDAKIWNENVLDSINDALFALDRDGAIRTVNPAAIQLLGYDTDELLGYRLDRLLVEDGHSPARNILAAIESGCGRDLSVTFRTRAGALIPMMINGAVLRDGRDEIIGAVCVARDVREMRRLAGREKALAVAQAAEVAQRARAEELAQANTVLQESQEKLRRTQSQLVQAGKLTAVGALAGGVAHELNTPLQAVILNAKLLEDDLAHVETLPTGLERLRDFARSIDESAERCAAIVRGLLRFSRRSGGFKTDLELSSTVAEAVDLVSAQIRHQETLLKCELDERVTCIGNQKEVQQVVINLLLNAARALGEGGVIIVRTEQSDDGREARILVQDDGPGIEEHLRDRIFDPFFTTKPVGEGTGLGLSISYGIVEDHGGTLTVTCPPEGGSVFTVALPREVESRS